MLRIIVFFLPLTLFLLGSCEKCTRCSYSYTITTIQQTVNGEQEVVTTHQGWVLAPDSTLFTEECVDKDESFTIETAYQIKGDTTVLDDYTYTCEEL